MHTEAHGGRRAPVFPAPFTRRTAGRGRPLVGSVQQEYAPSKATHKLAPMLCVLWLRECRAYLRHADLTTGRLTTTPDPHEARRLPEDEAETFGQDVIDATGARVELRPYYPREAQLTLIGG
ncbi:hypothetical protein [Rubrivivax gelatinosus]|uniref:Uncharacterized protein n=1 Tax=Rubrivivax gelatinosus TaxID=28068 RepID=A0A4R2M348_RUBGE|nr:hypothetical protein [Rubrivivax gelatinosus]MBK1686526.1 hypothetical protein [Rubrivivax gelatinosus]TCP00942.1 hypothetical protein EV684_111147 [Rubrivivax gelatinosus]